jgi:hypothetical protein
VAAEEISPPRAVLILADWVVSDSLMLMSLCVALATSYRPGLLSAPQVLAGRREGVASHPVRVGPQLKSRARREGGSRYWLGRVEVFSSFDAPRLSAEVGHGL